MTRFVSFHSPSCSHTHRNKHGQRSRSPLQANQINKKALKKDIRINMLIYMYYTLFAPLYLLPHLLAFCLLSASHFLHHSVYFCLTHPLSNSVTSPYVSHLRPHPLLPLLCCQMPMIHIRSVYTSCCSSLSSHPHTLTSSSRFLPLSSSPYFSFFSNSFSIPPPVPLR